MPSVGDFFSCFVSRLFLCDFHKIKFFRDEL